MHEIEAGKNKTTYKVDSHTDAARGAAHNVDEAWGLYAGERKTPG